MPRDYYVHGHDASVIASHKWRTVENSGRYLLPHLRPGIDVLDVGCGPGTITADLAQRVAPGSVTGIDSSRKAIELARDHASPNCAFEVGDVYQLEYGADAFDVVHAHQVLQHLTTPVQALHEMVRVCRKDGVVAVRDADYGGMFWSPNIPLLDRWNALYHQITESLGLFADAGRLMTSWASEIPATRYTVTTDTWTFATAADRQWWGGTWAQRVRNSQYATVAVEHGLSDPAELQAISQAWERWSETDQGFFVVPHVQLIIEKI